MGRLIRAVRRFGREDAGATITEYALILALVAATCLAAHATLSGAVGARLGGIVTVLTG
jgi:Flp pilus assembly pilin Flp